MYVSMFDTSVQYLNLYMLTGILVHVSSGSDVMLSPGFIVAGSDDCKCSQHMLPAWLLLLCHSLVLSTKEIGYLGDYCFCVVGFKPCFCVEDIHSWSGKQFREY